MNAICWELDGCQAWRTTIGHTLWRNAEIPSTCLILCLHSIVILRFRWLPSVKGTARESILCRGAETPHESRQTIVILKFGWLPSVRGIAGKQIRWEDTETPSTSFTLSRQLFACTLPESSPSLVPFSPKTLTDGVLFKPWVLVHTFTIVILYSNRWHCPDLCHIIMCPLPLESKDHFHSAHKYGAKRGQVYGTGEVLHLLKMWTAK